MESNKQIMILAVIQSRDSDDTIAELNSKGFYVTVLSTTGGFLRQKNDTILIGTESEKLDQVLEIIKTKAGHRKEMDFQFASNFADRGNLAAPSYAAPVSIPKTVGSATVFVMNLEAIEKY